jgi:plastocyanin
MKKPLLVLTCALMIGALGVPAAQATSLTIDLDDNEFLDTPATASDLGLTIQWSNDGNNVHTSTQNGPWKLWDTGDIAPSTMESTDSEFAGTFAYHCKYHPNVMKGKLRVPMARAGLIVTLGEFDATGKLKYQLQQRKVGKEWKVVFFGKNNEFEVTAGVGSWQLRSRVIHTGTDKATGWSPLEDFSIAG